MTRRLSKEDREVWERLRQTVRPLRKRRSETPAEPEPEAASATGPRRRTSHTTAPAPQVAVAQTASVVASPSRLDEKTRRGLSRGAVGVDARIDLHGMRQERAHRALVAFLLRAQAEDVRIVLVVTGKGSAGEDRASEDRRGVLRQSVPGWLAHPDLREIVAGLAPASRRHGGDGALYVRLRRRRAARVASR